MEKVNKDKKVLLLILSFGFVLILLGILGYFLSKNQKNNIEILKIEEKSSLQTTIEPTKVQSKPEPTRVLSKIDKTFQVGNRTLALKYDSKTKITTLFFKENGQEILINQWESLITDFGTIRNIPTDFIISSDNHYMSYLLCSEYEGCNSEFYNFPNKKVVIQTFARDGNSSGFTKDNKYFYACADDGLIDGGIVIYNLPQMNIVYQNEEGMGLKCQYNQQKNTLNISNVGYDIKPISTMIVYSFDSNQIISQ